MADKKISQLSAATTPLAGTEVLPIVQSGSTVKVSSDDLTVKNVRSNATNGILQVAGPGAGTTRVMTTPNENFTAARTDAAQTFTGVQTFSSAPVLNAGTANRVVYLNSGKSATTSNNLVFDGTNLLVGETSDALTDTGRSLIGLSGSTDSIISMRYGATLSGFVLANSTGFYIVSNNLPVVFQKNTSGTETARITTSGGFETRPSAGGTAVFNENGEDADFRVEGDTDANLLFVDASADNVGIGTSSPQVKLDIAGASTTQIRAQMSGQADVRLLSDTGTGVTGTYSNHPFTIKANSADVLTATAAGNVGIGTPSPSVKLQVEGQIRTEAPTGGTAANWRLGTVHSVSPTSPNRTIEVDIGGTIYYLHAKTTNN